MPWSDYQRCPGMEETLRPEPANVECPTCGEEVEIWTDEKKARCPGCKGLVFNRKTRLNRELMEDQGVGVDKEKLTNTALDLGASEVVIIEASKIPVSSDLAGLCREPRCENYGGSLSCPPHVGGPDEMRELIVEMGKALVFKIDAPTEILLSSDRRELGQLVHMIASEVEKTTLKMGAAKARAFAGGSCRKIFCREEPNCNAVDAGGACRHPETARPSISGFGIHAAKLAAQAGWKMWEGGNDTGGQSMGILMGLVLIK